MSLQTNSLEEKWIPLKSTTLRQLSERPLIRGRFFRTAEATPRAGDNG